MKSIDELKQSKTFCVFPFTHLATLTNGSVTPCCIATPLNINLNGTTMKDAWNHSDMKQIRLKIINDQPIKNCEQCYADEKSGVKSHRNYSNEQFLGQFEDKIVNALDTMSDDGSLSVDPFTLDIRAGNTCNLKCVMCRPNDSSKWVSDAKKIFNIAKHDEVKTDWSWKKDIVTANYTWVDKPEFWAEFETLIPELQELIFGGGEPFLSKSINELLQYMVDTGHSKHIKIRFHTNGTHIPETFWPLVDSFKQIELMFSIDAYDQQNHYVRFPADWTEIEKNLRLADQTKAKTMFLASLHSLNVLNLTDLYEWKLNQPYQRINEIPIMFGRVYHPTYLNPQRLPESVKSETKAKIEAFVAKHHNNYKAGYFDTLLSNLSWVLEDTLGGSDALVEYVKNLDEIRGTDFKSTFPELHKLLM